MKRCVFLLMIAVGLLGLPAALAADAPLDQMLAGEWLVLGPLPNLVAEGLCQGFTRDLLAGSNGVASEATVKPFAGMVNAGQRWMAVDSPDGRLDFNQAFGPQEAAVAYAWHAFEAPAARSLALKVGSDDGIKIWLNGMPVLSNHTHRALTEFSETVRVDLRAGINHLVVKVDQGIGDWKFALRLRSLAEEAADARAAPPAAFQLFLDRGFIPSGGTLHAMVSTTPTWALADTVHIELAAADGRVLAGLDVLPGKSFDLPLQAGWSGLATLRVRGGGGLAGLPEYRQDLHIGDRAALRTSLQITARARSLAAPSAAWSSPESILAATWQFLGDQIAGRLEPALASAEREDRALLAAARLAPLTDAPAALLRPGQHQWAYRSPIDGSAQPFSLYVPAGYDPAKRYRLAVWLHGYSGNDWDAARLLASAAPADFIILAPYGRGSIGWQGPAEQDVLDLLELVGKNLSVDPDRIYLAGNSMGGLGVWRLGQFQAGRFAAIAPFCGWTPTTWLPNLQTLPTLIVHGDADSTVPISADREAAASLAAMGAPVRFDVLPGGGHDAWQAWIKGNSPERLLSWFRTHQRDPWPDRVTVKTAHPRYGQRQWVRLAALVRPGEAGSLSVERIDDRHLRVATENVASFELRLDHPRLARSGRLVLLLDGQSRTLDADGRHVRFDRDPASGRWTIGDAEAAGRAANLAPHDGGGAADLFYRPLYIVYGTRSGNAAGWEASARILSLGLGLRVVADRDLSQDMLDGASLFLLGSAAENSVTARLARALPATIEGDRVTVAGKTWNGAGALQCCPNPLAPSKLVAVFTCPFGAEAAKTICRGLAQALLPYGRAADDTASGVLPDILLFDSGLHVIWTASFDRDWRRLLPAAGG